MAILGRGEAAEDCGYDVEEEGGGVGWIVGRCKRCNRWMRSNNRAGEERQFKWRVWADSRSAKHLG